MAHFKRICFLFVLLLLSHELLSIEGRNLRQSIQPPNTSSTKAMSVATKSGVASPSQVDRSIRNLEGDAEAFRPTTPGHSPGVGHSINN
ncbi:hypothetical protein VNO77_25314 [Canavalia gladiata]|uniref:Encoded peptide n=1 Tax=Canavalia gladiata TaxID=3824 RepID=A0AAN9QAT3_CANGL